MRMIWQKKTISQYGKRRPHTSHNLDLLGCWRRATLSPGWVCLISYFHGQRVTSGTSELCGIHEFNEESYPAHLTKYSFSPPLSRRCMITQPQLDTLLFLEPFVALARKTSPLIPHRGHPWSRVSHRISVLDLFDCKSLSVQEGI